MYVDAILDRKQDTVRVVERHNHTRRMRNIPAQYVFYYEHAAGSHRSIFGHRLKKYSTNSSQRFRTALREHESQHRIFESDINTVFRCLFENYRSAEAPGLHVGFFDIEAGFDPERGFAPTDDPFNPITAISLHRSFDNTLLTFALKPPGLLESEAAGIISQFDNTTFYTDERELLQAYLDAIDDIDVFSTWNGSAYDVPYLVNRIIRILNRDMTRKLCLWDQLPSEREYMNKFGKMVKTYDLVGRVHLDYLELYAKHNPQQRLSYALNAIGELEVGETKIVYEGSLDDLYNKDFHKFIAYNRQDVMLMVRIDQKLKYIELQNQVAHANCVLLKTTMGSVALIEQAIINEMHDAGKIAPNRPDHDDVAEVPDIDLDDEMEITDDEHAPVVGAYVATPKTGLHEHIGCVDLRSLYPSTIRALNMSPDTLVGQVRLDETMQLVHERAAKLNKTRRAEAWDGIFETLEMSHMHARDEHVVYVDFFDLETDAVTECAMTGKQLYDFVFDPANHVCITANGTIFRTDVEGIIPRLLGRWYSERKELQAKQHEYETLAGGMTIADDLAALLG